MATTRSFRLSKAALSVAVGMVAYQGALYATDSWGITQIVISTGVYDRINICAQFSNDAEVADSQTSHAVKSSSLQHHERESDWAACLQAVSTLKSQSTDVAVNSNTGVPGAFNGWHSHPGLSIVTVTEGALTMYDGDDPTCTPVVVTAGHGFVEPGQHTHYIRNEGLVDAKWVTTAIRPAGSAGRIDQPSPGNCPF